MPLLLTIPREVRFQILELVLCSSRAPPANPATTSQNRIELRDGKDNSWDYGPTHNKYEEGACPTNGLPLLLTNRQVGAETQSVLQRPTIKRSYSLDVMFVNEQELWPTWLRVPALWTRLDEVVATFRICGNKGKGSGFRGGDGGPQQIVWCFYSLMVRFLTFGPVGERKLGSQDRNITIRTLTLDVVTPSDGGLMMVDSIENCNNWFDSRKGYHGRGYIGLSSFSMRPEWLADFLGNNIYILLRMSYHTASYGMILYERIGTIRLCVDGVLRKEFDLCKMLADLRYDNPSYTFGNVYPHEARLPYFWAWKKKALVKRRETGLPVVDPEDPELMES